MVGVNTFFNETQQDSFDLGSLLNSLSLDVVSDNITLQINGKFDSDIDFLGIATDKFHTILEYDKVEPEIKSELKEQMIGICDRFTGMITDKFNLAPNMLFDDYQNRLNLLETLYHFFVLKEYDNVKTFIISYIEQNKKALIESLRTEEVEKDITTLANQKRNLSEEDIFILSHEDSIINYIRRGDFITSEEFLATLPDSGEATELLNYLNEGTLAGNFVNVMLNEVLGSDYDNGAITRIRSDIRIHFSHVLSED